MKSIFRRWTDDLADNLGRASRGSWFFSRSQTRSWDHDFAGAINSKDVHYALFLGFLALLPACLVGYLWSIEIPPPQQVKVMAHLFGAPLQFVISGFLGSVLYFLGSHVAKAPRPFSVAFKLMLRIMAFYPVLAFLYYFRFGGVFVLLLLGALVIRGALRTYRMNKTSAVLFFGVAYITFALLQLQTALDPPLDRPQKTLFQKEP